MLDSRLAVARTNVRYTGAGRYPSGRDLQSVHALDDIERVQVRVDSRISAVESQPDARLEPLDGQSLVPTALPLLEEALERIAGFVKTLS